MIIILIIVIQKLLIMLDLLVGIINTSNVNHVKAKDEELLCLPWHPTKRIGIGMYVSEDRRKELGSIFLQWKFDDKVRPL